MKILIVLALSLATLPVARAEEESAPSACDLPNVHSYARKVDERGTKTFSYHYQLVESEDPAAPLVIQIPGGPGDNSITTEERRPWPAYSLVLTDPRGAGCNNSPAIKETDITSERIADDIIELIRHLGPRPYILHGHSAGTVIATIVSAKIADLNVAQPRAVILEGTFGRYTTLKRDGVGEKSAWQRVFPRLGPELQKTLREHRRNPFGLDKPVWLSVINAVTFFGEVPWMNYGYDDLLVYQVAMWKEHTLTPALAALEHFADSAGASKDQHKTYSAIACNEYFDSTMNWMHYARGKVELERGTFCTPTRPHPYDSARWQMRHRTYYFNGENDPATPPWQAAYHYDHQRNPDKVRVFVPNGGHMSLQINLRDCLPNVYEAIFAGGEGLDAALGTCTARARVE